MYTSRVPSDSSCGHDRAADEREIRSGARVPVARSRLESTARAGSPVRQSGLMNVGEGGLGGDLGPSLGRKFAMWCYGGRVLSPDSKRRPESAIARRGSA